MLLWQLISRVKSVWAELDYAQRRSFELRTGIPAGARESRRRTEIEQLARMYALDARR